jgi:hypothetical protein
VEEAVLGDGEHRKAVSDGANHGRRSIRSSYAHRG